VTKMGERKTSCKVLSGGRIVRIPHDRDFYIINYDILHRWRKEIQSKIFPKVLILDESHFIKNSTAKRTKASLRLGRSIKYILALSGTPILNRPIELYNAIRILQPGLFPSFWDFAFRYCKARSTPYGWDYSGASNIKELRKLLTSTIMLRRRKKEVLKELPDKTRTVIPIEISNRKKYSQAEEKFEEYLKDLDPKEAERFNRAVALSQATILMKLARRGRWKESVKWVENFLESGEKLICFFTHRKPLAAVHRKFKDISVVLDGSTPQKDRIKAVDAFQRNDRVRLFLGNIKAAGVGITLTASSNVCFMEMDWAPSLHDQAEDRVHRIGQKEAVNIWYLVATDTIEEKLVKLLDKKRRIIDSIIDGKTPGSEDLLSMLMEEALCARRSEQHSNLLSGTAPIAE